MSAFPISNAHADFLQHGALDRLPCRSLGDLCVQCTAKMVCSYRVPGNHCSAQSHSPHPVTPAIVDSAIYWRASGILRRSQLLRADALPPPADDAEIPTSLHS